MDNDAPDRAGVDQTHVLERLRVVGGLVDTDACVGTAEDVGLAGAHPEDVGIRGRDGQRPGRGRGLLVEDRLPCLAEVVRRPHATAAAAGIDSPRRPAVRDRDIREAAADVGHPDVGPVHGPVRRRRRHRLVGVPRLQVCGVIAILRRLRTNSGKADDERGGGERDEPDRERSATSHGLTSGMALILHPVGVDASRPRPTAA